MVTVQSISKFDKEYPTAITIGTFDGVHIGHRKILDRLLKNAQDLNLKSTVLTFFPHPRMVLQKDAGIKMLNTLDEKIAILERLGLDYLVVHPFTEEFSRLTAEEFVTQSLLKGLNMKKIILGHDHRFGRNRNADINDLKAYADLWDFAVEEIPVQEVDEVSVSSTKIRKALEEGHIRRANKYLDYHYMLTGTVTKGKGLGKQIDFPTANLYISEPYKLVPKNGVYVVQSILSGKKVYGMMNIGFNPTVGGTGKNIEIHFFDFDEDLYGKKIQVDLLDRLRDEHKFSSVEELRQQLQKDKEISLSLIPR